MLAIFSVDTVYEQMPMKQAGTAGAFYFVIYT